MTESVTVADADLTAAPTCWDWTPTFSALQAEAAATQTPISRVVVLVPFAQVMWAAKRAWLAWAGDGQMPRFVTTSEWAHLSGGSVTGAGDITMNAGFDQATALSLLERINGLRIEPAWVDHLAQQVVAAAHSLAGVSAAQPPESRSAWAAAQLGAMHADAGGVARLDAVVRQLAIVWAGQSSWHSDVLWEPHVADETPMLCQIPGWSSDPLADALMNRWATQGHARVLPPPSHGIAAVVTNWLACVDSQDEALEAASAVIQHVNGARRQVGLVALDRGIVRRIVGMLELQGVSVRDETGWRLSTSRLAARVLAVLQAGVPQASAGEWVDAVLQVNPQLSPQDRLALARWRERCRWAPHWQEGLIEPLEALKKAMDALHAPRSWAQWGADVPEALRALGLWSVLESDPAGEQLVDTWGWRGHNPMDMPRRWQGMSLAAYLAWLRSAAEGGTFRPDAHTQAAVTVVPLAQLAYREFDALVLCGCDSQSMPAAPRLPGPWTATHRMALALPDLSQAVQQFSAAWFGALRMANATVCWRTEAGQEALGPSVWVLRARAQAATMTPPAGSALGLSTSASEQLTLSHQPIHASAPQLDDSEVALMPGKVSATRYQRLRDCPYQFFARDILGMADSQEPENVASARDFGSWVHKILQDFHASDPWQEPATRRALQDHLDECAKRAEAALGLSHASMLVYWASWPPIRDGYIDWWQEWHAGGARVHGTETRVGLDLGDGLEMHGDIDRIDLHARADGVTGWVLDYKTESLDKTKKKAKSGLEDTQLAFYVALAQEWGRRNGVDADWHAAYLNVSFYAKDPDKPGTQCVEQKEAAAVAADITARVKHDWQQIRQGAVLKPLGESPACDYCMARGLCRRDHWEVES